MSYGRNYEYDDYAYDGFAADAVLDERRAFIRRTYAHLFGAVLAFVGLETLFLSLFDEMQILMTLGRAWPLVFIGFFIVSWIAGSWANSNTSQTTQYIGLGLYVLAESVIFLPMLAIAQMPQFHGGPNVIPTAAFLTLFIFGGLTLMVMVTKKDFSFLGNFLRLISLAVIGLILVSFFTSISVGGIWFATAMIVLMSGYILYDTSNILHHYHTTQHVAAALALFASVATLFWYVLQFVMYSDD